MTDTPDGFRQMDKSESESQALEHRQQELDQALDQEVQSEMRQEDTGGELVDVVDAHDITPEKAGEFFDMFDGEGPEVAEAADAVRGQWGVAAADNLALIGQWVETPDGQEVIQALGDLQYDPGLLPAALIAARKWQGAQDMPVTPTQRNGAMPQGSRDEQLRDALAKLTDEQDRAMHAGDHGKAQQLDAQIMRIAAAISGDEPIVGGFGPGGPRSV